MEERTSRSANRRHLTKQVIAALPVPTSGLKSRFLDTKEPGLAVVVTNKGAKVFYFFKRIGGKLHEFKLGACQDLSLEQARAMAAEARTKIAIGIDPLAAKQDTKDPTLGELFDWYVGLPKQRSPKTLTEYGLLFNKHLEALSKRKAADIKRAEIRSLHERITRESGPYAANRVLSLVRAIFNRAIKDEKVKSANPAEGVEPNTERSREVRLLPSQLGEFLAAVESYPDAHLRDFFSLALLTGQRKSNVLAMRWEDVHLEDKLWIIPVTKNGRPQYVPLTGQELEILERRKREAKVKSLWVFPSHGRTGHLVEPKAAWRAILDKAGLKHGELHIHDLRRTLGSLMGDAGVSLPTIGKTLGHMSQLTTAIYARLSLDPVREAKLQAHAVLAAARHKVTTPPDSANHLSD